MGRERRHSPSRDRHRAGSRGRSSSRSKQAQRLGSIAEYATHDKVDSPMPSRPATGMKVDTSDLLDATIDTWEAEIESGVPSPGLQPRSPGLQPRSPGLQPRTYPSLRSNASAYAARNPSPDVLFFNNGQPQAPIVTPIVASLSTPLASTTTPT